jgi:hypothetical protein
LRIPNVVWRSLALITILVLSAAACGGDDGGDPSDPDNVLTNSGFEDGAGGWNALTGPATVSNAQAKSGDSSLLVELNVDEDSPARGAEIAYQELVLDEVPEFISFDYYVDNWVRGTEKQYIEALAIVTGGGPLMPVCPPENEPCPNIQMRYVLGGVNSVPASVLNARWRFVGDEEPATGEWLHFEANLRNEMTEDWGTLPNEIDSFRLQFEVRYDDRNPDELDGTAQVYWDNVYLGPR